MAHISTIWPPNSDPSNDPTHDHLVVRFGADFSILFLGIPLGFSWHLHQPQTFHGPPLKPPTLGFFSCCAAPETEPTVRTVARASHRHRSHGMTSGRTAVNLCPTLRRRGCEDTPGWLMMVGDYWWEWTCKNGARVPRNRCKNLVSSVLETLTCPRAPAR